MKLAVRMEVIKPSGTMIMAEKARERLRRGKKVYNLDVGEPDFDTPSHIKEAAIQSLNEGFTHYTSSRGIVELREAIADNFRGKNIEVNPESEIIVTPGAKHAIYCACMAILDPGDEVLVLSPSWPTHFTTVEAAEARAIQVPCGQTYAFNDELLKEKITNKSKMIIINSPNNPTGGVLSSKNMKDITEISAEHNLIILSDEIYEALTYDNVPTISAAAFESLRDQCIVVNGFSKTYAMTGWRLGYAFAEKKIINAMNVIQQATTTCPASFIQKAGIAALKGSQDHVKEMIEDYDQRRKYLVNKLNDISGLHCAMPKGAFYAFPDFSSLGMSSEEVATKLLEEEGVCSTPGTFFGQGGEGHLRLSYATKLQTIMEAVEKIKEFFKRYNKT